jgi:hypothetical protein
MTDTTTSQNIVVSSWDILYNEKYVSANVSRRLLQIKGSHSFRIWNNAVRDAEETHFIKATQQDRLELLPYKPVLLNFLCTQWQTETFQYLTIRHIKCDCKV